MSEMTGIRVIKVGGNELDSVAFCEGLARAVARAGEHIVVVHGGGRAISAQQAALGLPVVKVAGLRVTDAAALAVVVGVLCGNTNKMLVAALRSKGVNAVGLSGVDGGILLCKQLHHPAGDLGFVGAVERVNTQLLRVLVDSGFTPVLASVGAGEAGTLYNVNADAAAAAIAIALQAEQLEFLTDVAGIVKGQRVQARLNILEVEQLVSDGVIRDGMLPKVQAALEAVRASVCVRIVDLAGLESGAGTIIQAE